MKQNIFPAGWDEKRVKNVITHYEGQTDGAAIAEDEKVINDKNQTIMEIPTKLVPLIRELIAKYQVSGDVHA